MNGPKHLIWRQGPQLYLKSQNGVYQIRRKQKKKRLQTRGGSYSSGEMQSVYSTVSVNWAGLGGEF